MTLPLAWVSRPPRAPLAASTLLATAPREISARTLMTDQLLHPLCVSFSRRDPASLATSAEIGMTQML
eukprot:CAMPEP_0175890214 /NCGR_PEP_ID=MMETSP0107_2-20121207/47695_1 /TAXON_ID=195067 ORGANISM="Goniomonas pacifica, Strain CCMP1869" /NCGR_SAMPLE_ID=MMETSP0107_2 /ASSEMBLY_ACC=CAM_ASM_000203 /LENGTH=67 /DNA_ID=CAMNT_0017210937 /DNA_START=80 /DNA_END=283 /DNA_ORIENTATION=+